MIAEFTGRRQPATKSDATGDWLLSAEVGQRGVHHPGVGPGQQVRAARVSRVDQARLDKLLSEQGLLHVDEH
jgi:hypothetical protein